MVTCNELVDFYIKYLAEGFGCSREGPFIVLTTPFLYGDGDHINIYVEELTGYTIISDMGETVRRLAEFRFNWKSKGSRSLFANILNSTGTSSIGGKIYTKINNIQEIGEKFHDLVQALQKTDDLIFTLKDWSPIDFRGDVEIFLRKSGFEPELNYQIFGDSGTLWRVHFFFNHNKNILSKAISSNTKGGAKNLIFQMHTAYDDIKKLHPEVTRSVILDDTKDIWEPEVIKLADQVIDTEIGYWTKRDDYTKILKELIE